MIGFLRRWRKRRRKLRKLQDQYNWLSAKSLAADYRLKVERLEANKANRELSAVIQKRNNERGVVV